MNTISERLHRVMDLDPTAPAVEFEGTWSQWGDLGASADAVEGVLGECGLGAGTPVEVFLLTEARTVLEYIAKPILDQARRTFR